VSDISLERGIKFSGISTVTCFEVEARAAGSQPAVFSLLQGGRRYLEGWEAVATFGAADQT
jgi:hypothetical protein